MICLLVFSSVIDRGLLKSPNIFMICLFLVSVLLVLVSCILHIYCLVLTHIILLMSSWRLTSYHCMIILPSLAIFFALRSNLADINIAMLAFCY